MHTASPQRSKRCASPAPRTSSWIVWRSLDRLHAMRVHDLASTSRGRCRTAPALTEPRDLAWLLASYARDGLARVEAAGGAPQLAPVRSALADALGIRFKGERGRRFFCSTLGQTLFYGVFSAWVLWARTRSGDGGTGTVVHRCFRRYKVRLARSGLAICGCPCSGRCSNRSPIQAACDHSVLTEVLDWTAAALDRVDRAAFFARFKPGRGGAVLLRTVP